MALKRLRMKTLRYLGYTQYLNDKTKLKTKNNLQSKLDYSNNFSRDYYLSKWYDFVSKIVMHIVAIINILAVMMNKTH